MESKFYRTFGTLPVLMTNVLKDPNVSGPLNFHFESVALYPLAGYFYI